MALATGLPSADETVVMIMVCEGTAAFAVAFVTAPLAAPLTSAFAAAALTELARTVATFTAISYRTTAG
jgi:hypothetical protein